MKMLFKSIAAASVAVAAVASMTVPVAAQQVVQGIGVVDQRKAVLESSAYKNAAAARPTTYKAQYDQANAISNQVRAQLEPMVTKFNTDAKAATPDEASLQKQYAQIQQLRQQGQQQVEEALQPVALSEAYVGEQILDQFDKALSNAMAKRKVSIALEMGATLAHNGAYDITTDVTNELNALIPNAVLVPPADWKPRQQREAEARQQAAAAASPPAASTTQQPQGR